MEVRWFQGKELSQAKQRFSRLMSLRDDSGRLSLESVLSGTALGLALLYLINDIAAAASPAGRGQPAASGVPLGGGGLASGAGGSNASGAGKKGAGEEIQGAVPTPSQASPVADPNGRLVPASGLGNSVPPNRIAELIAPRPAGPWPAVQGPDFWPGVVSLVASSSALPSALPTVLPSTDGSTNTSGSIRASPPPGGSGPATQGLATDGLSELETPPRAEQPATPELVGQKPLAPDPEIPSFRVVLRSNEAIVSRSVEGDANTEYHHSLGTITDTAIDLRNQETPQVLVSSASQLHLLALSQLGDATLTLVSDHTGLNRTNLLVGPEVNAIRITVSETIDAGLMAGMAAQSQIRQSLIAMRDSQLQDSGDGGSLDISSLARFLLKAPGDEFNRQIGIDLLAGAMQNSTILLGDGNDRVTLSSGFRHLEGTSPGLLIDIPSTAGPGNDPSLQLRARSVGLSDSRLATGAGNDLVSIKTWLDPVDGGLPSGRADLRRIALIHSSLLLGAGNDQLDVDGAVLDSNLDLGSGDNRLSIEGQVLQSSVLLGPDSSNEISLLGNTDNSFRLDVSPGDLARVTVLAGGGDDRIQAPLERLAGSIHGGGGFNTLEASASPSVFDSPVEAAGLAALQPSAIDQQTAAAAEASGEPGDPLKVSLQAPGTGSVGSLDFTRIDSLRIAAHDVTVSIGAQAQLAGALQTARGNTERGHAALDYSTWQAPVQVDLSLGTASGILGGIGGFQAVLGGSGDDQLTAGAHTSRLDGGPGNDTIQLNLAANISGGQILGGNGRDTFVLSGLEAIQAGSAALKRALPPLAALADLRLETTASGGIGLTDILQWRQQGIQTAPGGAAPTITLTSSGLEGLGQPQLLPIAPLAQLLAGMAALEVNRQQLAIATGPNNSSLILLGADRSYSTVAELPSLRLASNLPATATTASTPTGLAG